MKDHSGLSLAAPVRAAGDTRTDEGDRRERQGLAPLLAGVGAGLVLGATTLFVMAPWDGTQDRDGVARTAETRAHQGAFPAHPDGGTYRCAVGRHDGRTYAGHSGTQEKVIGIDSTGWEVVEAQCLLREAGFAPGGTDGIYGRNTFEAVQRFQQRAGLADDGAVGPGTWKALRG